MGANSEPRISTASSQGSTTSTATSSQASRNSSVAKLPGLPTPHGIAKRASGIRHRPAPLNEIGDTGPLSAERAQAPRWSRKEESNHLTKALESLGKPPGAMDWANDDEENAWLRRQATEEMLKHLFASK